MKNILVLHGPNLNLLGEREKAVYGLGSLASLDLRIRAEAARLGLRVRIFQRNGEGQLIDLLHKYRRWADGIIFNPGAYTHYSYALRDAVAAVNKPTAEVHLSDIRKREAFRRVSVIAPVCAFQIFGEGQDSYLHALRRLKKTDSGVSHSARGSRRA